MHSELFTLTIITFMALAMLTFLRSLASFRKSQIDTHDIACQAKRIRHEYQQQAQGEEVFEA